MSIQEDVPLYSSRITNTYLEYIQKYHPEVDIDEILQHAEMKRYEVEDPGHWFTQRQVDRFHEKAVERTGNPNLPRDAGRLTASSQSAGAVRQYGLGLLNPLSVYLMAESFYSIMTRGATAQAKKLGPNKVELTVKPKRTVLEKPYQCLNRMGTFESLSKAFTHKYAHVTETQCYHKGDKHCRYVIEWERTPSMHIKLIRNYLSLGTLAIIPILFFILPTTILTTCFLGLISIILVLSFYSEQIERKELYKTVESQGNAAKELVNEINFRHNNALLVQEIGQVAATIVQVDKLVAAVMKIIMQYLFYDRGMILLSNPTSEKLIFHSGIGYENQGLANANPIENDSALKAAEITGFLKKRFAVIDAHSHFQPVVVTL